jgi:hypothetical protein
MFRRKIVISRLFSIVLVSMVIATACGPSIQATTTPTVSPTPAPPTATMTNSPTPEPTITPIPTSTPLPDIDLDMELPEGDAEAGYLIALRYRCHGCHENESHPDYGPRFSVDSELPFILERGTMRIKAPDYEGKATTNQEYMIESIFLAEAYIVPGEWEEPMPTTFQQRMSDQELADILAWIATLK